MYVEAKRNKMVIAKGTVFALLASVAFCHHTIFKYIEVIIGKLPIISFAQPLFFPLVYIILILLSYKKNQIKYVRIWDYSLILFFTLSILLTIVIYPKNEQYILDALNPVILPCIPFFFLGLCFTADEKTINTVSKFSCIAIIISVAYVFYYMDTGRTVTDYGTSGYSMYWSYLLLPNIIIAIDYAFRKKKALPIICSIIGVIYAFAMGTRGSVIILFAFLTICLWRYSSLKRAWKISVVVVMAAAVIVFVQSPAHLSVLTIFRTLLHQNGFSTRVVDYFLNGEMISYTSGRMDIYQDLLSRLGPNPFLGFGIYGEWPLGYYSAHNMYIEVLFHFGIVIGAILIICFVTTYIKGLIASRGTLAMNWIIMFGCLVFIKGIFGGRYMEYTVFFLLGFCLKEIRQARNQNSKIKNSVSRERVL